MSVLSFLPLSAALAAVFFLTPQTGALLRKTPIYTALSTSIEESLQLDTHLESTTMQTQTEIIENMELPSFLKESLIENNNNVIYELLNVDSLQGYIAGFLANVCTNILSVIVTFFVVFLAVRLLLGALNLISKLPVLNLFNRCCGFLVGTLKGVSVLWVVATILTFFRCKDSFLLFFQALENSRVAAFFYENNLLLYLILRIFS